jgi:hypothetical protein
MAGRPGNIPNGVAEWLLIEWPEGESAPTQYWLARLGAAGLVCVAW